MNPDDVGPQEFSVIVDESAGGPEYRLKIIRQRLQITIVVCGIALLIMFQWALVTKMISLTQDHVKADLQAKADRDLLIECTTPAPAPGKELNEKDKVHDCWDQIQIQAVRLNVAVADCVRINAPDLLVCVSQAMPSVPALGGPPPSVVRREPYNVNPKKP